MKQLPILGQILEVLLKFEQTKFYDDEVFDSKLADCLLRFQICVTVPLLCPLSLKWGNTKYIFDELRDLLSFVQFKKSEKHPTLQLY